jgi:hypothetical protein
MKVYPSLRQRTRKGRPRLPLVLKTNILASAIRKKSSKRYLDWKGKSKTGFIHQWHNRLKKKFYGIQRKVSKIITLSKVVGYGSNTQNSAAWLTSSNKQFQIEILKIHQKHEMFKDK